MSLTTPSINALQSRRPGAHVHAGGVTYCVWAPEHPEIAVEVRRTDGSVERLRAAALGDGYFGVEDERGNAGDRYGFVLDDDAVLPDPASRYQPDGVHGLSACVDPQRYSWRAENWRRPAWRGQSIYELHIGTFTPAGTFAAAIEQLDHLVRLGVEAIEIMPVADFPGGRNWGYDGVALYAPARCYGPPDDFRRLIDAAHERGLAVVLDVVYNHFGPDGNYLSRFAPAYFHPDHHTPWGQAFNLSGPQSAAVRAFFVGNAAYWFDEYRIDGLRLDATHALVDDSPKSLLREIADVAHARGAFVIAEDERNTTGILRRPDGTGDGLDGVWADDFHHQLRVALTGIQDSYFKCYRGSLADIAATLQEGWTYTGQGFGAWNDRPRGEPGAHLPPHSFVYCIENHDQVGNRARGERLEHLISPAAYRAASALLLLSPYPPLLFMGQEWAASTPFLFFTDHAGELGRLVTEGRRKEFPHAVAAAALGGEAVPDPQMEETFARSKLVWEELRLSPHATVFELYRECLRQRATWLRDHAANRADWRADAVGDVLVIRYFGRYGSKDRLVLCCLGGEARLVVSPHPLLVAPADATWELVMDSNALRPDFADTSASVELGWTGTRQRMLESVVFGAPATLLLEARPLPPSPDF